MRKLLLTILALLALGGSGAWADDWSPRITGAISVGNAVEAIETASSASDNTHWYIITQSRGGETAIYDNGSGIMRGAATANPASFEGQSALKKKDYLVRFIATGEEGVYNIQFGSGRFAASYATTPENIQVATSETPGAYAFYNCNNGTGSYFGWNLGNATGKSVNNNGVGATVVFYNSPTASGTTGNNIWVVYPVTLNDAVDCSSDVIKMSARGGTNPAVFYNSDGAAQTGSAWYPKYITNTGIPVTIDCGSNARLSNWSGGINAYGTVEVTISVPTSFRIKSYSFGAQINNAAGTAATATPIGGAAVNIGGSSVAEVSANSVNSSSTSITFTGAASSGTECILVFTDFKVEIEDATSLSQSYGEEATVFVNATTGTFGRTDGTTNSTWKNKWVSDNPLLPLSLGITASNMSYSYVTQDIDGKSFNMACGNADGGSVFTLTAPEGYLIKDYKFSVMSATTAQTITPSTLSGTAVASGITSPVTIQVKRVYDKTAVFTVTGTNGNLKTTNFIVTLVKDGYTPDGQIYQVVCQRAGLAVGNGETTLKSTCASELDLALSGSDTKQQFAFVQHNGNIYLYSVGEQKFVSKKKTLYSYSGDPITIFPTGNTEYPYAFKFSDSEVVNHNTTNVTIEAWGGTTSGELDGGNCFKLLPQGSYTLMSEAETKLDMVVKSLSDVSQTTSYTISTVNRGNWYVPSGATAVTSTLADDIAPLSSDTKQQFAFIKDVENFSENYYLYNVSEKKFVTVGEFDGATGTYHFNRALIGAPDLTQPVTLGASTNSNTFPAIISVNGRNLGISTSYYPMVIDYQSTADDGNNSMIVPADESFDPTEAQLILLQAHARELSNLAGTLGYPKTTATVTTALLTQIENPTDYSTLWTAYNDFLAGSDIVLPQEGKTYTIANYAKDGTIRYLYNNGGTTELMKNPNITDDYKFICHVNGSGKFIFAMPNGNYLIWRGNSEGENENKGQTSLSGIMSHANNPLTISKFSQTNASNAVAFGKMQIVGKRGNGTSSLIVKTTAENTFDKANATNFFTDTYSSAWIITEVPDYYNAVTMHVASDGNAYATVYLPFAATVPADVRAFYASEEETSSLTMTEITGTIPANTAVVLVSENAAASGKLYLSPAESAGTAVNGNKLTGTVAAGQTPEEGKTMCVFGDSNGNGPGFYKSKATTIPLGKAVYMAPQGSEVKSLNFGTTTVGISEVAPQTAADAPLYDLSGRRVASPVRGIYVRGGRKVVVR